MKEDTEKIHDCRCNKISTHSFLNLFLWLLFCALHLPIDGGDNFPKKPSNFYHDFSPGVPETSSVSLENFLWENFERILQ
jgi:hypothetical protein